MIKNNSINIENLIKQCNYITPDFLGYKVNNTKLQIFSKKNWNNILEN